MATYNPQFPDGYMPQFPEDGGGTPTVYKPSIIFKIVKPVVEAIPKHVFERQEQWQKTT